MEERGKSELKGLEMEADLMNEVDEVGVTGLVGFEDEGSELPSLVRFFLRNPREGMGQTESGQWVRESNRRGGEGGEGGVGEWSKKRGEGDKRRRRRRQKQSEWRGSGLRESSCRSHRFPDAVVG